MSETQILRAIREDLNRTGLCWVTRNNVGVDLERGVRYGLGVGSPDLVGVLIPSGIAFGVEVKASGGHLSREQQAWWRAAHKRGVRGGVARSVPEARRLLDEALKQ